MYKNLNPEALSINGRQSELIELTLTHGFRGFDLDLLQFQRQVEQHGLEHAARFLKSAPINMGPFDLPFDWVADDAEFAAKLAESADMFQTAQTVGSKSCRVMVHPADATRPYHANFEFYRQRIAQLADALAPYDIRLGLTFLAPLHLRETQPHPFISSPDALLTLIKTANTTNVGVVVDLWHWHVGGGTIDLLRGLNAEQIVEVRLADLPENATLETVTEADRLMPGATGAIDLIPYLALLAEMGYDGPVTPCPHPSQFAGQKREFVVRTAASQLENLLKQVVVEPTTDDESDTLATSAAS